MKSDSNEKLCGKNQSNCGVLESVEECWYTGWTDTDRGNKYIKNSWTKIVTQCLESGNGDYLEKALTSFKVKFNEKSQYVGKGTLDCDGMFASGVCVKYSPECGKKNWWIQLEKVIRKDK
ncbi:hypothetical protein, unlikely [Trypanosoma congolense IL3000]|uniref:Variant surface glycoprotein n=1 Tax=Trypanosoma congolense (strain IL3000) TaxID=1068625 RepID=F9WI23_TRYCI|nr:hypothetical protein, unlikely [Trypanosoma congolense IL3000]